MTEALAGRVAEPVEQETNSGVFDFIRNSRLGQIATGMAASVAFYGVSADMAHAGEVTSSPPPVTSAANLPSGLTLFVSGAEGRSHVTARAIADGSVTILSYERAKGLPKKYETQDRCYWTHGGYNSGDTINGPFHPTRVNQVDWFYDPRWTYVCRVPKTVSPTGYAKAGNHGPNGTIVDNCGNDFQPGEKPPEHVHIIPGKVLMVKDRAKASLNLHVAVSEEAIGYDQNGEICGVASAEASAHEKVRLRQYFKSGEGRGNVAVRFYDRLLGRLSVRASASVHCGTTVKVVNQPTPVQPPPVTEVVTITPLTSAEPLYPNSPEQLCVDVSDSNGSVPNVSWQMVSGEGSVVPTSYTDQDGNPDHQCSTYTSGPDVGISDIRATAVSISGNAQPVSTDFSITTQQDSGFTSNNLNR